MKIILKTGNEINVTDIIQPDQNTLYFTVPGVTDYQSFIDQFTPAALTNVQLYENDNMLADYGKYSKINYPVQTEVQEDGTMTVKITLGRDDALTERINALEDAVETLILSGLGAI